VRIAFTGSYVSTSAAVTSARSVAGRGGSVTIDGGATGGSLDGSNLVLGGDVSAGQGGPGNPAILSGSLSLDGASRTFTVSAGADAVQPLVSAVIRGSSGAGLIKAGPGTLRLLGNNTYTGPTTVQAGALVVDGTQAGSNIVLSGGTLAGSGTVGSITVGGTLSLGDPDATGVLTGTGSAGLASATTFTAPERDHRGRQLRPTERHGGGWTSTATPGPAARWRCRSASGRWWATRSPS
jgi:autotransporter-associated beta strand protein